MFPIVFFDETAWHQNTMVFNMIVIVAPAIDSVVLVRSENFKLLGASAFIGLKSGEFGLCSVIPVATWKRNKKRRP